MGCVSSKQAVSVTPAVDTRPENAESGSGRLGELEQKRKLDLGEFRRGNCNGGQSLSFRLGNLQKLHGGGGGGGEHVLGAGWPVWLTAVAGEAIRGWVPLRTDKFEKLEKIGQGTYSSVFRARNLDTGKIVALKKVRFDNFEPESVRFMAREIMILRRLDHPNIIKLEGIITSRLSCSIYLVFEYMEHDLSGLLACPDIQFSESQVKCYTKQLLSGLEHCHSRGVMHRDIKGSNLLINNEGILKIADFGLANFSSSRYKQPLTSRVVTLWYRPPELLLGSTEYGASVDLWSVGCVFAECYLGRPILPGRTEVEQLHKIFKLCGSPPDEFWKKSKLPHATLSKPTQPYESCLRDTFKHLPVPALSLIETLLSVEPYKRGTAFYALSSEYFKTKPYACDPSSLPKYPPNKEIDAKNRDDARRKKTNVRSRGEPTKKRNGISKLAPAEDFPPPTKVSLKVINNNVHIVKEVGVIPKERRTKSSIGILEDVSHVKHASQGDIPFSGPLQMSTSSGFAWAKRHNRSSSKCHGINPVDNTSAARHIRDNSDLKMHANEHDFSNSRSSSRGHDTSELAKLAMHNYWSQIEQPDSFDASDRYHSQELSLALFQKEEMSKRNNTDYQLDGADKIEFSGPLLSQKHKVDEFLARHERQIRQTVWRSWFQKVKKSVK